MGAGAAVAPAFAAGIGALGMAAWWLGRRQAAAPPGAGLRLGFPLFALGCLCVASSLALAPVSLAALLLPLASAALLGLAALLAVRGARLRSRADALRASAPQDVDEAVAALRRGAASQPGVFRGRLGARGAVTSPAGLVCAFYESELRADAPEGKGTLLTQERAQAPLVCLRGERHEVALSFSPSSLLAPVAPRRCSASASMASGDPRVLAGAEPVEQATSHERVGRIGEPCLVVGTLEQSAVPGRHVLKGLQGGPALLVLGTDGEAAGAQLARRAWAHLASAAALTIPAAFLLSRL